MPRATLRDHLVQHREHPTDETREFPLLEVDRGADVPGQQAVRDSVFYRSEAHLVIRRRRVAATRALLRLRRRKLKHKPRRGVPKLVDPGALFRPPQPGERFKLLRSPRAVPPARARLLFESLHQRVLLLHHVLLHPQHLPLVRQKRLLQLVVLALELVRLLR